MRKSKIKNQNVGKLKIFRRKIFSRLNFDFCVLNFDFQQSKALQGFTLLEMLVSIGIFAVVIISSIAVLLSIRAAQEKVSNTQSIQDNIRFTLELMTKEMRQGTDYTGQGCAGSQCTGVRFRNFQGQVTGYCNQSGVIARMEGSQDCAAASPMTSDNVVITQLFFYLLGNQCGTADGQPRITIAVSGRSSGSKPALESYFNLQTTVTQRIRDYGPTCLGV